MRTLSPVAAGAGFEVGDLRVRVDRETWLRPQLHTAHRLVLVRRGVFRLRVGGTEGLAHPIVAYLVRPGDAQQIAHRVARADTCTVITVSEQLLAEMTDPARMGPPQPVLVDGRTDLMHRTLARSAAAGVDEFELRERVTSLLERVLRQRHPLRPGGPGAPAGTARRAAESARERLSEDPVTLGLATLARELNISPPYLSRVFHRHVGMSMTKFRNQMRVGRVLDRIEAGDERLAVLAAEFGFADHAHLSRTLRSEVGEPPTAVRRLLGPAAR